MHSSRPEHNTSNDRNGAELTNRHGWSDDEAGTESLESARLGVVACILFMAGGLYWTASVGLLTLSALTAYPVMISAGILLTLMVFGATLWTPRGPQSASRMHSLSEESNGSGMNTYDSVTGLPTYRLFTSLLKQAVVHALKYGRPVAVLMIELEPDLGTAAVIGVEVIVGAWLTLLAVMLTLSGALTRPALLTVRSRA
jgi:hypothetical protein